MAMFLMWGQCYVQVHTYYEPETADVLDAMVFPFRTLDGMLLVNFEARPRTTEGCCAKIGQGLHHV